MNQARRALFLDFGGTLVRVEHGRTMVGDDGEPHPHAERGGDSGSRAPRVRRLLRSCRTRRASGGGKSRPRRSSAAWRLNCRLDGLFTGVAHLSARGRRRVRLPKAATRDVPGSRRRARGRTSGAPRTSGTPTEDAVAPPGGGREVSGPAASIRGRNQIATDVRYPAGRLAGDSPAGPDQKTKEPLPRLIHEADAPHRHGQVPSLLLDRGRANRREAVPVVPPGMAIPLSRPQLRARVCPGRRPRADPEAPEVTAWPGTVPDPHAPKSPGPDRSGPAAVFPRPGGSGLG